MKKENDLTLETTSKPGHSFDFQQELALVILNTNHPLFPAHSLFAVFSSLKSSTVPAYGINACFPNIFKCFHYLIIAI
jgi:hypothetical protein